MSMEDLVSALRGLSRDELRELVRQVPALREAVAAVEREQVAEARAAYQVAVPLPSDAGSEQGRRVGGEEGEGLALEERRTMGRDELAARYKNPVQWTEHPWVVRVEGYKSGRPIILGTSIMVRTIAIAWVRHGTPIWDVLDDWPLHEAQVYDALAYYYDHKEEIDEDIRRHYDVAYWMRKYPPGKGKPA